MNQIAKNITKIFKSFDHNRKCIAISLTIRLKEYVSSEVFFIVTELGAPSCDMTTNKSADNLRVNSPQRRRV